MTKPYRRTGARTQLNWSHPDRCKHVLDSAGITPKIARNTRLVQLAADLDPKILAAAFGLTPEAALYFTADRVDTHRIVRRAS